MNRSFPWWRRLWSDEQGATIAEFAFVLVPMLTLILGGFEVGYQSYLAASMQGALTDAARRASVETPDIGHEGDSIQEQVEAAVLAQAINIAPDAEVSVSQRSFFEFSDVGNPELLMTDHNANGQYDEGDCFEDANFNGVFDLDSGSSGRGSSDDVVFYTATITAARLLPVAAFTPFEDEFTITLETAIRNQPYGTQPVPPTVCDDD